MQNDAAALREACVRLAQRGVEVARKMQHADLARRRKADGTLVTAADEAVQRVLTEAITAEFPRDAIIAEESLDADGAADPAAAERFWVIDPIDGTRSFARGIPWYSCSVAVADRRRPLAGAVVEAGSGMVFSAVWGGGAYLNGQPIHVRNDPIHRETFVAVPSRHEAPLPNTVRRWPNERVVRNYGSTALHLALVAAGMLDAALVMECHIWDVAAAGLMVLEAGGGLTDHSGRDIFPLDFAAEAAEAQWLAILAAGPRCHADLLAELQSEGGGR